MNEILSQEIADGLTDFLCGDHLSYRCEPYRGAACDGHGDA